MFNRRPRAERLRQESVACNPPCPELGESHLEHQIKSLRDNQRGEDDDKQDPFMVSERWSVLPCAGMRCRDT